MPTKKEKEIPLDATIALINLELEWCYANPMSDVVDRNFRDGFIEGLRQAKRLITELAKIEYKA